MRLCGWHLGRSLFGSIGCNICLLAIGRGLVLSVVSCLGIVLGLYGYNSTLSINASRSNFAFSRKDKPAILKAILQLGF